MDSLSSYSLELLETVADGSVVLRLEKGETRSLPAVAGGSALRVEPVGGTVWLTAEGCDSDWVMNPGQRWECPSDARGRVVVQALSPAIIVVSRISS